MYQRNHHKKVFPQSTQMKHIMFLKNKSLIPFEPFYNILLSHLWNTNQKQISKISTSFQYNSNTISCINFLISNIIFNDFSRQFPDTIKIIPTATLHDYKQKVLTPVLQGHTLVKYSSKLPKWSKTDQTAQTIQMTKTTQTVYQKH